MSTLSSMAITGASSVAVDIYKGYVKKEAPDKKVNILLKVLSLVFIVISALLAILKVEAIVAMMSLSWGTLAGCFIGPYIYGLYSKKITSKAAMASLIAGVAVTVILVAVFGIMYPSPDAGGVWAVIKGGVGRSPLIGVVAMAVSMIITPVVSAFTKKPDAGKVGKMFENINTEF
jgi:Na+/proline symporter